MFYSYESEWHLKSWNVFTKKEFLNVYYVIVFFFFFLSPFWEWLLWKLGFPCGSAGKKYTCNMGDLGLIPGLRRFLGEGKGYPLQYSGLENSMDCVVHGDAMSQTWLSNFTFTFIMKISWKAINIKIHKLSEQIWSLKLKKNKTLIFYVFCNSPLWYFRGMKIVCICVYFYSVTT